MINVWDLNAKALIAFSLVMIMGLLTYIAFYKDPSHSRRRAKS